MLKQLFDIIFSFIGIILLLPVFLIIAIIIKLDSKGSVFYRGVRVGKNGKLFRPYKFRTMVDKAENLGGSTTAENDSRITKVGRFLRKYKIDEIPQFINVIKGDMSIVGPRPELKSYTGLYNDSEKIILNVRPGITDLCSLEFSSLDKHVGSTDADKIFEKQILPRKNQLRVEYVKNQSFLLDLKIICRTVWVILMKLFENRSIKG